MAEWTHVEEVEARHGHLRGTPREYVLDRFLESAKQADELRAQAMLALRTEKSSNPGAEPHESTWTHEQRVESEYGHLKGTPKETFFLRLQESAQLADKMQPPADPPEPVPVSPNPSSAIEKAAGVIWLGAAVIVGFILYDGGNVFSTLVTMLGSILVVGLILENAFSKLGFAKPYSIGSMFIQLIQIFLPEPPSRPTKGSHPW